MAAGEMLVRQIDVLDVNVSLISLAAPLPAAGHRGVGRSGAGGAGGGGGHMRVGVASLRDLVVVA